MSSNDTLEQGDHSSKKYELINNKQCLRFSAHLETRERFIGDTTADWNYDINLHGMCIEPKNFTLVP
ncbi:hypothetical protein [Pleionea sp. CnH1-48]|uniref:hypothetical protein n=1 Tax=Pleionea sp. CnH1-48 TaxID=2954494 RepID=UPI0020978121|nr:hypothetical protein [Pleionea sp. CnH1-48]MCO7223639.1 hypothetical protein [Pleionea sp. CnH1-48]